MNLLEYEAKAILGQYDIPVPSGVVVHQNDIAPEAPIVLKSQVHTGGRGKAGGVKVIVSGDTRSEAERIFDLAIKGEKPRTILAEEVLDIAHEYYVALMIDRSDATIELVAHHEGGIEVESHDSREFFRHPVTPESVAAIGDTLADQLDLAEYSFALQDMLEKLVDCFTNSDAILLEINPLVLTRGGQLVAGDCKLTLDPAATFRHPEWNFEASQADTNFVSLDPRGTVATIANGAGLAMATVDAVQAAGLSPANFLDIGGGATTEKILDCFRKIVEFEAVDAIVINIFGGIVRCDLVAEAIIAARKQIPSLPRLYIRLSGNNSQLAAKLLAGDRLELYSSLDNCLQELPA